LPHFKSTIFSIRSAVYYINYIIFKDVQVSTQDIKRRYRNMNIDSIIFDLDGTLWDSTDIVLKAWEKVVLSRAEIQRSVTREELQGIMGLQLKQCAEKLFPYLSAELQMEIMKECCNEECDWIRKEGGILYANLEETLKNLSEKLPLFIVSNCNCGYIEAFLEYHGLQSYFVDFECAGNTGLLKGENIKKIIDKHNLKHPIYVGDTKGDFDGAKLANIPFVFAGYGFGKVEEYDYIIKEIAEMVGLVGCKK
jgi:phosphoglycolate phosphatase